MLGTVQHGRQTGHKIRVYYEGTDTLYTGYALCYNADYGTAASVDYERCFRVEKPSVTNNYHFAGVVTDGYNGFTGPGFIDIWLPGTVCPVRCNQSVTVDTERITVCAGQYYFAQAGFAGKGSAKVLQTLDCAATEQAVLASLEDGVQSGLAELVTPANGAMTIMVGGVTYFPATTIAVGDATYTLPDSTILGMRKAFFANGAMVTNDIVITVTTCYEGAGSDVCTIDAAAEYLFARWNGKAWHVEGAVLS